MGSGWVAIDWGVPAVDPPALLSPAATPPLPRTELGRLDRRADPPPPCPPCMPPAGGLPAPDPPCARPDCGEAEDPSGLPPSESPLRLRSLPVWTSMREGGPDGCAPSPWRRRGTEPPI